MWTSGTLLGRHYRHAIRSWCPKCRSFWYFACLIGVSILTLLSSSVMIKRNLASEVAGAVLCLSMI